MPSLRRGSWLSVVFLALLVVAACKGDTGEQGPPGEPGEPGEPGQPPDMSIEPEPNGLVGRVMEPNMRPVPGGTVYLVPASDVEELSQTEIDIFLSPQATAMLEVDEPIEDLLDTKGASYESAAVEEGVYRFEELPPGSHFVVWVPAAADNEHLPGGDSSRVSFATEELIGMQMDIRVSTHPSPGATYVGSSTCMGCHGLHTTTRTAHNVGLQVPGVRSILQDIELWPKFDDGLAQFSADAGGAGGVGGAAGTGGMGGAGGTGMTTLYYFDCSQSSSTPEDPSNCKVAIQNPGSSEFQIDLRRDSSKPLGVIGAYYVEMVKDTTTERYDVMLTYGGALGKQQYLSRRQNADGSLSYFVLPFQYNYEGDFNNDSSDDWPWRDYRSDLWYDFNSGMLRPRDTAPLAQESFDNNCAGCHFTGYGLEGSQDDGWSARAVADSDGAFDYDGDGRPELINVGCESCHGPGSDHLMPSPNGRYIVSPGLLTAGRQAMLCGSCHSRPLGIGGGGRGLPLSIDNEMPPPGIRRRDFALNHTTQVSGPTDAFFDVDDPRSADAKANYQQYSDHIRSGRPDEDKPGHYRNGRRLVTCTGCHSPHANDADVAAMDTSGNPNALCTTCHSQLAEEGALTGHVDDVTPLSNGQHTSFGDDAFSCFDCHMVPTAKSGAANKQLRDQYYWNDIASHRMIMTRWRDVTVTPDRPVAFTNECGFCHAP